MKADVNMSKILSETTLRVEIKGLRAATVRLWIAARLIRCAAWVLGCGIEFEGRLK
jgi:hypothetical protein